MLTRTAVRPALGSFVAALVILGASIPACRADEWGKKYLLQGKASLRLEATQAAIRIRGGDVNWVEAHVATAGWKIGADGVVVSESQQGDVIALGVQTPVDYFEVGTRAVQVDLIVPRSLNLIARTGDGTVEVEGFGGEVHLVSGRGRIVARRIDGMLEARTGDGALSVSGRFDRLDLETRDGGIDVKLGPGSSVGRPWRIRTGAGEIRLDTAADLSCAIDARSDEGKVQVTVPGSRLRVRGDGSLRGQIGNGGPRLTLRARGGSITVRRVSG